MLDSLIDARVTLREIEPQLFSALPPGDEGAHYDVFAAFYDRMVASPLYLRLAWGCTPSANAAFIRRAFESCGEGWVVDVAAGSCVDAVATYATTQRPTLVVDLSLAMLRRGMDRLRVLVRPLPENIIFLQADASSLPIRSNAVRTVLCHGAYHVFPAARDFVAEWRRVLHGEGAVFVSSLVRGRWFGDRYLNLLQRTGEVSAPFDAPRFAARLEETLDSPIHVETVGNFAYAYTRAHTR